MKHFRLLALLLALLPMAGAAQSDFPFPQIPSVLTDPADRLDYMLQHYWDEYNFRDTTKLNQDVAEQGLSDFINLMQYADTAQMRQAADRFSAKAFANEWGRSHYEELIEHYLGHPESPLRNDIFYACMLRSMNDAFPRTDERRSRFQYQLRQVAKNQVGTKANDFDYVTRDGKWHTLQQLKATYTLIIFSDPECEHCQEAMPKLIANPALQDKRLTVLSVYPDRNTQLWKKTANKLPSNWIDAYSPRGIIMEKQIYYLPALPSLYLLDAQKQVLIKDGKLEDVLARLKE